ncbi:MAG: hypothetical protein ACK476_10845, partial [Fluviicola sp.]
SSSKPAANLSVYLVELPKVYDPKTLKMKDIIVTRAWADPQNYKSLEKINKPNCFPLSIT